MSTSSSEVRVVATTRTRGSTRLDDLVVAPAPTDPTIDEIAALGGAATWIGGGEPTLRADLPELVAALGRDVGLCTDGLALADAAALAPLVDAGLRRVSIALHSARTDAHDWLVARPGAARRAIRAIRACVAAGLDVRIEATAARPTTPYLAELATLAARLGARGLRVRRLLPRGPAATELVMLAARFGPLRAQLRAAHVVAKNRGLQLDVEGFPTCVAPDIASTTVEWRVPAGTAWDGVRATTRPASIAGGCTSCAAEPACAGAPADYVERFGWTELETDDLSRSTPEIVRFAFGAGADIACDECAEGQRGRSPEPTRSVRTRLVRASGVGARVLRVESAGSLAHPAAAELLRETLLLGFDRVEIAADGSALAAMSDADLYPLTGISRVDVALYGPDAARHDAHVGREGAFDAALRGLARFQKFTGAETGAYAVLHDAADLDDYAAAWEAGTLPGAPAFRLSPRGAALQDLAAAAAELPQRARDALCVVLPPCLLAGERTATPRLEPRFEIGLDEAPPGAAGPRGIFEPCVCDPAPGEHCPGIAAGWSPPERSP